MSSDDVVPNDPKIEKGENKKVLDENEEESPETEDRIKEEALEKRRQRRKQRNGTKISPTLQTAVGVDEESPTPSLSQLDARAILQQVDSVDVTSPNEEIIPDQQHPKPEQKDKTISNPTDRIYIQMQNGFHAGPRGKMLDILEARRKTEVDRATGKQVDFEGSMRPALLLHNAFHTIGIILQGLIAGFSICACMLVILFTPPFNQDVTLFINNYAYFALPLHTIFYVIITLCTLASFDRYDPGESFLRAVWRGLTLQSGGWCTVFYMISLIFSLLSLPAEHALVLYQNDVDSFVNIDTQVLWLKVCSIGRAISVTLAWFMVALRPNTDVLFKRLAEAQSSNQPVQSD